MASYVTKEGLDKMKQELEQLETIERPKITQQIAEARDKGDLSENAEYDAAKEAQGMLEMKIVRIWRIWHDINRECAVANHFRQGYIGT